MLKKILPWFVFSGLIILIIIGMSSRDRLNSYMSETMIKNAAPVILNEGSAFVDSAYNYADNGGKYEITFLEFGSTGCVACRKMEKVMKDIKTQHPNEVNVVFMNILKPESQMLMKYYGIVSIPTQVLLDKEGNEFFRHNGYIPTHDLKENLIHK